MDSIFKPAKDAAYRGDVGEFEQLLRADPALVTLESKVAHPDLFQFVAVEGGLGEIPTPLEFVRVMISLGGKSGPPLVAAASVNSFEIVDELMHSGAKIESGAPWTALEEALYWSHFEMADHLLNTHKAAINSLRAAAQLQRMDLLPTFFDDDGSLKKEAGEVHYPFGHDADTPMATINQACFLALRNNRYDAAQFLFEKGAELNTIALGHHERCTALHQAVYLNQPKTIEWLLDRGARTDVIDPRFNATPIQWAEHFERDELVPYMSS